MKFIVPLFTISVGVEALWKIQWFQQPIDHRSSAEVCLPTRWGSSQKASKGAENWGRNVGSFQQCLGKNPLWSFVHIFHQLLSDMLQLRRYLVEDDLKAPHFSWGKFLVCHRVLEVFNTLHFLLKFEKIVFHSFARRLSGASRGANTLLLRQWRWHRGTQRRCWDLMKRSIKRFVFFAERSSPILVASCGRLRSLGKILLSKYAHRINVWYIYLHGFRWFWWVSCR